MRKFASSLLNVGVLAVLVAVGAVSHGAGAQEATLRIGMIGLDTSHVIAFTKLINDPTVPDHVPGGKVVAAYKGGSDDIESSYSRVDGFTKQLQDDFGVQIVGTAVQQRPI